MLRIYLIFQVHPDLGVVVAGVLGDDLLDAGAVHVIAELVAVHVYDKLVAVHVTGQRRLTFQTDILMTSDLYPSLMV